MIGYVTLGTDDLDRVARLLRRPVRRNRRASRLMEMDSGFTLYGTGWGKPGVAVTRPYNGEPARAGNGNMVSLVVDSRDKVDRLHAKALELGGSDEGAPGASRPGRRPRLLRRLFPRSRRQQVLRLPDGPGMRRPPRLKVVVIVNRGGGSADGRRGADPRRLRRHRSRARRPARRAGRARAPLRRGGRGGRRRRARRGRRRRHDQHRRGRGGRHRPRARNPADGHAEPFRARRRNPARPQAGRRGDRRRPHPPGRRRRGQRPGVRQQQRGRPLSDAGQGAGGAAAAARPDQAAGDAGRGGAGAVAILEPPADPPLRGDEGAGRDAFAVRRQQQI